MRLNHNGKFRNVFEEIDVDVWSTHYWLENLLLSRYLDKPNFFRFPGIKSLHIEWKIMARFADPDFYVANSRDTSRRAKEWLGIECEDVVYAGVDLEQFSPEVEPAFENDDFNIIYVGRLDAGKGLFDLLKAFTSLNKEYDNLRLWLVGEGSLQKKLQSRAGKYDIEGKVEFPGKVNHSEVQSYYVASELFCLPSHHESFGIVNLEAMACGVPVVTTDLPVLKETMEGEKEGLFFERGSTESLKEKIEYLIENPKTRNNMGKAGRKKAKKFGWDKQAEKMEKLYERCTKTLE